jgi:pilus assembly protein CpaB
MNPRTIIFIVLALILAGVTANFARSRLTHARQEVSQEAEEQLKPKAYVLVAGRDLASGAIIHAEDMHWQSWPDEQINEAYLLKGRDDLETLTGAVVRLRLAKGEPLSAGRVIKPGERGFLAAVLAPGMRGTSIPLTASSDVAGLILPGDHVDLILSHPIKDDRQPNAPARVISETVLTNLRVVAIDQTVNDQEKKPLSGKTATFEVTPKQAEMIEVAKMLGNLSLVLRSAGADDNAAANETDADGVATISHTWDSDVSPAMHGGKPESKPNERVVTVLRGGGATGGTGAPVANGGGGGLDMNSALPANTAALAAGLGRMR